MISELEIGSQKSLLNTYKTNAYHNNLRRISGICKSNQIAHQISSITNHQIQTDERYYTCISNNRLYTDNKKVYRETLQRGRCSAFDFPDSIAYRPHLDL